MRFYSILCITYSLWIAFTLDISLCFFFFFFCFRYFAFNVALTYCLFFYLRYHKHFMPFHWIVWRVLSDAISDDECIIFSVEKMFHQFRFVFSILKSSIQCNVNALCNNKTISHGKCFIKCSFIFCRLKWHEKLKQRDTTLQVSYIEGKQEMRQSDTERARKLSTISVCIVQMLEKYEVKA